MVTKLDLKQSEKAIYAPTTKTFSVIDVPPMNFLMIDGSGNPNTSSAYQEAVEALFSVSYTLKFTIKKAEGIDYAVMPLEGLWWADDMRLFTTAEKDKWQWTMMIRQPDVVTEAHIGAAMAEAKRKSGRETLPNIRFERYHEGLSVQIMHLGPFSEEGPTLARMHQEYIPAQGYVETGKHHEIYLSDIRRAAPEKWRTVLRQPVKLRS